MAVVLVTGCSSGFGLEIALGFARRGDQVVATMRDTSRATALMQRAQAEGLGSIAVQQLDVTDAASIDQAVQATLDQFGRVDVVVNNAGIGHVGALEVVADDVLRQVFETNVFGAIALTRALVPHMRQQGSGRIVFMSAVGGVLNTAYLGAYCASKHAVDNIAATWDIELQPFGIRVSSILPSAFNTDMSANLQATWGEGTVYEDVTRQYFEGITSRMRGGPADLSPVVNATIEAATAPEPKQRYLVSATLGEVLAPLMGELERLHEREVSLTPKARN